jgi:hypothetical protein
MIEPYELEEARAVTAAVKTLKEHLTCGNAVVEVQAARTILRLSHEYARKQLIRRVEELEQGARERNHTRPTLC